MTKEIFNIFSKQQVKEKKESPKEKIIIDYREKGSLVPANLIRLGFELEFKELKVADYLVKEVAIERKTVSDFVSSMINRRLFNQIEEIKQYEKKLLIIEGLDEQELYSEDNSQGVSSNAIRGFLLSITLKHQIPIIFTKNAEDTAKFIAVLSKKEIKEYSLNAKKKTLDKKEQLQFIIEGFPGIGPKNAKKLLEKFHTIKDIINSSEDELKEILGKKAEVVREIIEREY
jgi:Fanconi anemia group M protein